LNTNQADCIVQLSRPNKYIKADATAVPAVVEANTEKCKWLSFFKEPAFTENPNTKAEFKTTCTHLNTPQDLRDKAKYDKCRAQTTGPLCVANGCLWGGNCYMQKTRNTYDIVCT